MSQPNLVQQRSRSNGNNTPRRHLLIAGTGRAGTSALVRYLTALGLETHLSKRGAAAEWDHAAQAGLEDFPLFAGAGELPYVVKSPWSYQFIDDLLADPRIRLDAAILPIRNLVEAAASRTILQLQAIHQETPAMAGLSSTWEHWASTRGGTVFSLEPLDQARLLATGFHHLLERLLQADVPTLLLVFPRFTADPDYLFHTLSPILPPHISLEQAREAHMGTFSANLVRVGHELDDEAEIGVLGKAEQPSFTALDNIALRRGLADVRERLAETAMVQTALARERDDVSAQLHDQRAECATLRSRIEAQERMLAERAAQEARREAAHQRDLTALSLRPQAAEERLADTLQMLELVKQQAVSAQARLAAVNASTAWRATLPFRIVAEHVPFLGACLRRGVHAASWSIALVGVLATWLAELFG